MLTSAEHGFDLLAAAASEKLRAIIKLPQAGKSKGRLKANPTAWGYLHEIVGRESTQAPPKRVDKESLFSNLSERPYLEFVHPSRLLGHLCLCPEQTRCYLLHQLPPSLKEAASHFTGLEPKELPSLSLTRNFIIQTFAKFYDALETSLAAFAPESPFESLLKLTEKDLRIRAQGMALYALESELKLIIDKHQRLQMKTALQSPLLLPAVPFIRFLREQHHDFSSPVPYRLPLELWSQKPEDFEPFLEKFGFACLGRLLFDQSDSFKQELALHLSANYEAMLTMKPVKNEEVNHHLLSSLQLTEQFITHP